MPRDGEGTRERELLRQIAEGRQEALAKLYDLHAASLFRHALVLARHRADAEDLVHSVFVKMASLGPDLLAVRSPTGYLHRMLHTTWIDGRRRSQVADRIAAGTAPDIERTPTHDDAMDVTRALAALPPEQREVVVLHALDGFSFRQIGQQTGVSLFTAAARYRLAVAKLRVTLNPFSKVAR